MREVPAIHNWKTNAELIEDVASLHLTETKVVFDATYGRGVWWRNWQPELLITNDIRTEAKYHDDFTALPWRDRTWDCVAYDPPYKLSGTNQLGDFDDGYGLVDLPWQDRMEIIVAGAVECARVAKNMLLVKCQDQVVSGRMVWQTLEIVTALGPHNWRLADRFDMLGGSIPQPGGRTQKHARGRGSTLLVFK